jgi:hypothetical protein
MSTHHGPPPTQFEMAASVAAAAAPPVARNWLASFFAQPALSADPRVVRCDNCGAPLDPPCRCANVRNLSGVVGVAPDPLCVATKHEPGRHACRFCGVTSRSR